MPDRFPLRPVVLTSLVFALACGDDHGTTPVVTGDLSEEWQTASPASQGLDPVGIAGAVAHARTLPRLLSLLVVRNGVLVVEQYFNGNHADSLNDGRSVTKSVVSTLVGVALHQAGGSGIRLRPRDLAKIGALWLQRGETGRETLLDQEYVDAATGMRFGFGTAPPPLGAYGYGYSWWIARTPHEDGFFAWGFGGQFIFVAPAESLVVVVTTELRNAGALAQQLELNGLDLIVNHVLPTAR